MKSPISFLLLTPIYCSLALAQQPPPATPAPPPPTYIDLSAPDPSHPKPSSNYILGPFDQVAILVGQFPDQFTDRTFRIDNQGDVSLPIVGHLHAAGLTPAALEDVIKERFAPILKHPDVVVNLTESTSQNVSILGAVKSPGVRNLVGKNNLFEVLSLSGGLADNAGTTIKVTRDGHWGLIPWPNATADPNGKVNTATVHLKDIAQAGADSFTIMPGDTIFVPKADLVYAVGDLNRPGGFSIGENESISALQVVSLAGGLVKTAASKKAKILRLTPGTTARTEIPVDIKKLMAGKSTDIPLLPQDILFVPNSDAKSIGYRTIDSIVAATSGLALAAARF